MAMCQVIQKHGDADVALSKYRIVYGRKPECAQVWNNIGMCFFSKKKFVAAISCLKRANYLAPFELYVLYNLALVHLHLQQYASAAVFLQSAIRLNRKHAPSYALLGVTLSKLNDYDNALRAYNYSLKYDPTDPMALLNFAILQHNTGASRSAVDGTLQQFYQYYAAREASVNPRELDPAMRMIAEQINGPATSSTSSTLQPPSAPIAADQDDSFPMSSASALSPREPPKSKGMDDDSPRKAPQELPTVRTKIYEDGRHRGRRAKPTADSEPVQNEEKDLSNVF